MKTTSHDRGASTGFAGRTGSALDTFHCPKCGKLRLKRDGTPHKCGPTDKQRIAELLARVEKLAGESAVAWSVRQHLHDYLEPDNDVPEAAKRAVDEAARLRGEMRAIACLIEDSEYYGNIIPKGAAGMLTLVATSLRAAIDGQNAPVSREASDRRSEAP